MMPECESIESFDFNYGGGKIFSIVSQSVEITRSVGAALGKIAKQNDIICLDGDLGAGKTAFTGGIAIGMGIRSIVPSPTFTILIEHTDGAMPLYHFDAYRIGDEDEFYGLGLDEYFSGGGVCVVEWAKRIKNVFPDWAIQVLLFREDVDDTDRRRIVFCFPENDERFEGFSEELKQLL